MTDAFLKKVGVTNSAEAMRNSLRAALQHNRTYAKGVPISKRELFRRTWAEGIIGAVKRYGCPVGDAKHCQIITQIARHLADHYSCILIDGRLRFGTCQKAFNLYLKFLWRLGDIPTPPHCPVDGVVLRSAGISGSWTQSDSAAEYMRWIEALRLHAGRNLAEWEYETWNRNA